MPLQPELFPRTSGFQPSPSLQEPRLWVSELRVYRVLAPGAANLLRRVQLQPGLNILWAKPRRRAANGEGYSPGVSGHGTGKTTFCRFLRYILGEGSFGNDEQRARLREKFPEGWVVGEVILDGTRWLVCRPFKIGPASYVYRNRSLDGFFATEDGKEPFKVYETELTRVLAEQLPVTTFSSSPTTIDWPHVLQWLTRDQESRFSGLAELRHSSSESHAPDMMAEDRHFLFRAVLGLIDTAEQSELENNKELLRLKQIADRDAPLLRFRGDSIYQRLRTQHAEFRADLAGTEFLEAVATEWRGRADATEAQMTAFQPNPGLKSARDNVVISRTAVAVTQSQISGVRSRLGYFEQQLKQLRGEQSEAELAAWVKQHDPNAELMCGHTLAAAIEHECPLAAGRKLLIEKPTIILDTRPAIAQVEAEQARATAQLQKLESKLKEQLHDLSMDAAALERQTAEHDGTRAKFSRLLANEEAIAAEAARARSDPKESERLEVSITDLELKIRRSQDLQSAIREKRTEALSAFSDTFDRVARTILDEDVKGEIRFRGRKIHPTLTNEIDLTSAALETLKIICFDLAAVVSAVEGRGQHPRFLLHDGPREADMDVSIYHNIFRMARALEQSFSEHPFSFQYVITTTESPPEDFQQAPWLLQPVLDASEPGGKLLGENF